MRPMGILPRRGAFAQHVERYSMTHTEREEWKAQVGASGGQQYQFRMGRRHCARHIVIERETPQRNGQCLGQRSRYASIGGHEGIGPLKVFAHSGGSGVQRQPVAITSCTVWMPETMT